jgi:hypothetical protein
VARHVQRSASAPVESSWRGGTRGVTEPLEPKEFGKTMARVELTSQGGGAPARF